MVDTQQLTENSPGGQAGQSRPHTCSICRSCFRRVDHLRRHMKLHLSSKHYQCPCGESFSRNDVLAQHLRRCSKAPNPQNMANRQQTRTKRACDRCAKIKMKCNSQSPCDRCTTKSIVCEYTRPGYIDAYEEYGINCETQNHSSALDVFNFSTSSLHESPVASMRADSSKSPEPPPLDEPPPVMNPHHFQFQPYAGDPTFANQQATRFQADGGNADVPDLDFFSDDFDVDFGFALNWNAFDDVQQPACPDLPNDNYTKENPMEQRPKKFKPVYSLLQTDPVESKCAEMRALFQLPQPLLTKELISANITRDKLLVGIELFGKHFQRNYPILHAPSFSLIETPPILLLAMMLTGACYANDLISNAHITKLAMRLLVVIENLPVCVAHRDEKLAADVEQHEITMQAPSLSTIQASIILCGVLILSRNEVACKFVLIHFTRNISMASRAGIFDEVPSRDYRNMPESSFNWLQFIEQESRKRIACEIFSQDMAACFFLGKPPAFSPLTQRVELPCYETCWEAQSSSACFHLLQQYPGQMQISTATRMLRTASFPLTSVPLFEASAFGMFTLLMGLHGFVFQTIQEDVDSIPDPLPDPFINHINMGQSIPGATIAEHADAAVAKNGSAAIQRANAVLNAWHRTWECRQTRDPEHENLTFKGDPIRFWWLAKLFLLIHVKGGSFQDKRELTIVNPSGADEKRKIALQAKLIGWMATFRKSNTSARVGDDTTILPDLMIPL